MTVAGDKSEGTRPAIRDDQRATHTMLFLAPSPREGPKSTRCIRRGMANNGIRAEKGRRAERDKQSPRRREKGRGALAVEQAHEPSRGLDVCRKKSV